MNFKQSINERIIEDSYTILMALKKMDAINKKLLIVFNKNKFIGVLSIGDIQRSIVANLPFDTKIKELMRSDFVVAKLSDDRKNVFELMRQHRIECMPVLDENKDLVDAYFWDDIFDTEKRKDGIKLNLPVIIMAGGKGTRLKPLTNVLPKPLIPVNTKTIIELIMDKFCEVGCDSFFISVNYKADMIKYYLDNLNNNQYTIKYIDEDKPLGTAGSLHSLNGKINSTFFVSNCDILINQDINDIYEYHKKYGNEITVVAALLHIPLPYGILETTTDGVLSSITEKPELTFKINTGFYILEPHLLKEIPYNKYYDITSLLNKLNVENRKVGVFPISEKSWNDFGDWNQYKNYF